MMYYVIVTIKCIIKIIKRIIKCDISLSERLRLYVLKPK